MSKPKSKFRRRLPLVGIFLLLVIGISFFLYPVVGEWYASYTAETIIREYDETIQRVGNDALNQLRSDAVQYNEALAKEDMKALSVVNYEDQLAVSDAIGYIEIPKIGVHVPIFHGLSERTLKRGIGHMEGSSLPVGGESTHSVLAGHTGLPGSKLFTDLDVLEYGDFFYVHVLDEVLKYKVDQIRVVLPREVDEISIVDGKDYVTLVTCTPYGINDHRLLVRGVRIIDQTETPENVPVWPSMHNTIVKVPARTVLWYAAIAVIAFVILMIIAILVFPSFKKRRKNKPDPETNTQEDKSKP